jgi:hypothetical protein
MMHLPYSMKLVLGAMTRIRITIFLLLIYCTSAHAQVYKPELEGKFLPAKVLFADGVIHELIMKYQQPEYFKNQQNKFSISRGTQNEAYEQTGNINAFMIDNTIWALKSIPASMAYKSNANKGLAPNFYAQVFVILRRQGVIEQLEYIVNGESTDPPNTLFASPFGQRSKMITRNTLKNEIVEGDISLEKIKEWIADSPEVVNDLKEAETAAAALKETLNKGASEPQPEKKGLLGALEKVKRREAESKKETTAVDLGRIINNYNLWYEQRNQGKIKYYFAPPMTWENLPTKAKSIEEVKAERMDAVAKVYAKRSTEISPEMASSKDNTPVKKETFGAKLQRIKADGNKIGVLLNLKPTKTPKPESGALGLYVQMYVEDEYLDESLNAAGQQLVEELNLAYHTSDFELIDISKIPYKDVKVFGMQTRVDNWWATKYKVVFAYTLDPRLGIVNEENTKYTVTLNMIQSLIATEYIGAIDSNKQDILTQILNFGSFLSSSFTQTEEPKAIRPVYEKALEKMGSPLVNKVKDERADGVKKLVEKRLKLE